MSTSFVRREAFVLLLLLQLKKLVLPVYVYSAMQIEISMTAYENDEDADCWFIKKRKE